MQKEAEFRAARAANILAQFLNIGLGAWMITAPVLLGYAAQTGLLLSDIVSGLLVMAGSFLALSWRAALVRWVVAAVGLWVNDRATGVLDRQPGGLPQRLARGHAHLRACRSSGLPSAPGRCLASYDGRGHGATTPKGWDYSPSDWSQRIPIIVLAFFGYFISRYLAAYQLGHVDGVWEPFFAGAPDDPKNGTEEIITSSVSRASPVPDAGLGALTYQMEILIGLIGSARRWRTMPWLVMIFGIMIVPLGMVSITFIVLQPIVLGTWCTLCLVTAAAMLIQIPYSVDELIATCQFLARRRRAGRPILRVFLTGDTDDGPDDRADESFEQPPMYLVRDMLGGGMTRTWGLAATIAIGIWLMVTRLTLGTTGTLAEADHLVGALAVTVAVTALAESARPARFLNMCLGGVAGDLRLRDGRNLAPARRGHRRQSGADRGQSSARPGPEQLWQLVEAHRLTFQDLWCRRALRFEEPVTGTCWTRACSETVLPRAMAR